MKLFPNFTRRHLITHTNLAKNLPKGSSYGVMVGLPPELSKLRGRLLKKKNELPFQQKKEAKLKYLLKAPFIQLVVAGQVQLQASE